MTGEEFLIWLQVMINYQFSNYDLLRTVLITPGFEGNKFGDEQEKRRWEGNRTSAQLGESLVPLVVRHQLLLVDGASRAMANIKSAYITSRKHQEERAELLGIKAHLKLNSSLKGEINTTTLSLALFSIIGAVWLDCDQNFAIITKVVHRLLIDSLFISGGPKEISSENAVDIAPGFFDEWIFGYEIPGTRLGGTSLDISRIDPAEDHHDHQESPSDTFIDTVINSEAMNMENAIHQQQDATVSSQILGTTALNVASCFDLATLITSPSSSSTHIADSDQTVPISEAEKTPVTLIQNRKRKPYAHSAVSKMSISDDLSDYMRLEEERCHSLGLSFASNEFDMAMKISSPRLELEDDIFHQLKMLYFAIGSVESLVSLKSLLGIRHRLISGKQPIETGSLTVVERMKLVENLNEKIAYNVFHRRYHTYHLYTDSRASHHKTLDGFVNNTIQSMSSNNAPRMGNPVNLDENQISKNILHLLHPDLAFGTKEYQKKLSNIRNVRKLGRRFDIFVKKFGYGIIGLLPLSADDLTTEFNFNVSDKFILSINDAQFIPFIECLEQSKGKVLKDMSCAVLQIVKVLFEDKQTHTRRFAIEQIETAQILRFPSGSQKLLELISNQQDRNYSNVN